MCYINEFQLVPVGDTVELFTHDLLHTMSALTCSSHHGGVWVVNTNGGHCCPLCELLMTCKRVVNSV